MSKRKDWIIGLTIIMVSFILIIILVTYQSLRRSSHSIKISSGGAKVAVVELLGPIYEAKKIVHQFQQYKKQKSIKAIVFRIDSPGGGVATAQEIYEAVKEVRDSGKPVVASFGSVAASGGYYVACGADTIMANPGTTTGSIGVIAEFLNFQGLFKKIGIHVDVIKSGRFKDTGSSHRPLTPSDRRYLQNWVDDAYDQFVTVVANERDLSKRATLRLADGRVFTGRQARNNGLVDLLGDYEDAIRLAADMASIEGKPTVVKIRPRRRTFFDLFFDQVEGFFRGSTRTTLKYIFQ